MQLLIRDQRTPSPTTTMSLSVSTILAPRQNATPIYGNSGLQMLRNPGSSWTNNATFGARSNWTCPASGESNAYMR